MWVFSFDAITPKKQPVANHRLFLSYLRKSPAYKLPIADGNIRTETDFVVFKHNADTADDENRMVVRPGGDVIRC